jgi:hypothetical protein
MLPTKPATIPRVTHTQFSGMKRVAVAMAGELRTLASAVSNMQAAILRPLGADLFMDVARAREHAGRRDVGHYFHRLEQVDAIQFADEAAWSMLLRVLRPVHVHVWNGDAGNKSTFHGLLTRWTRLHGVIVGHERLFGRRYDWIIRVRPDLLYTCKLTPRFLAHFQGRVLMKWDLLVAFPREAADVALTIGSLEACHKRNPIRYGPALSFDLCVPSVLYEHKYNVSETVIRGPKIISREVLTETCTTSLNCTLLAPNMIALILRDDWVAQWHPQANGTSLPTCKVRSFRPSTFCVEGVRSGLNALFGRDELRPGCVVEPQKTPVKRSSWPRAITEHPAICSAVICFVVTVACGMAFAYCAYK